MPGAPHVGFHTSAIEGFFGIGATMCLDHSAKYWQELGSTTHPGLREVEHLRGRNGSG